MTKNGFRLDVYWTQKHDSELVRLYKEMKSTGMKCEKNGKANVSAILLFALQQTTLKK